MLLNIVISGIPVMTLRIVRGSNTRHFVFLPLILRSFRPHSLPSTHIILNMEIAIQQGKTAFITGAASGVGFAVAKLCRTKGMHLALADIDRNNLAKAKEVLAGLNSSLQTETYVFDVADSSAWKVVAQQIAGTFPQVDLVVLNAGKSYKATGHAEEGRLKPWVDSEYWKKVREF